MGKDSDLGVALAASIQSLGWRQGSVFRLPPEAAHLLPDYMRAHAEQWLVLGTQSCSVCSANFAAEPRVEVLAATPLAKYKPSLGEARGKTNHTFHLPVKGLPRAEALACHMGRRAFLARERLLDIRPELTWLEPDAAKSFKAWLAHHYLRVALPDRLVERIRAPGGVKDVVKAALEAEIEGRKAEEGVITFYISWSSDEDLPEDKFYGISLVAVCNDEAVAEHMDRALAVLVGRRSNPLSVHGVVIEQLDVRTAEFTNFAMVSGKARFNEWDDMSALPERLRSMQSSA